MDPGVNYTRCVRCQERLRETDQGCGCNVAATRAGVKDEVVGAERRVDHSGFDKRIVADVRDESGLNAVQASVGATHARAADASMRLASASSSRSAAAVSGL